MPVTGDCLLLLLTLIEPLHAAPLHVQGGQWHMLAAGSLNPPLATSDSHQSEWPLAGPVGGSGDT